MKTKRKVRVVLVPYPFQGHITPMLQLGTILHSKGFSITIAHTNFNSPHPSIHPQFTFLPLPDKLDGFDTSFYNILNAVSVMNTNCEAPFEEYLVGMMEEEELLACVIYDSIMTFVDVVALRLDIPTMVLRTTTAAYMHSHLVMFRLLAQKLLPSSDESQLHASIPKAYPLRFKDLPLDATKEIPKDVLDFIHSYTDIRSSSGVIWNTVDNLDSWPLQQLQRNSPAVPFFAIGPLHKMAPTSTTSLIEEDANCMSWLDRKVPNSVIYVSLGSLAIIDEKELIEMARGLAKSEQPFLWVVRPSLLSGTDDAMGSLPEDFKEAIGDRGLVVKWAPQKKVLAHPAVGGFFTHCGWNSSLESICEGVPLICRPCFADQKVNARYMTHVWKIGIELEVIDNSNKNNCLEKRIERAVRTLMVSEQGKEMRKRAIEMKVEVERSMEIGGSSCQSLDRLVEFIISLSRGPVQHI
ncbi:hypothetical protein ABFS83_14G074700 [Erythranthe nasuta]